MDFRKKNLSIVVPCYNEQEVLPTTLKRLVEVREKLIIEGFICSDSTITFVDDGSRDQTWQLIEDGARQHAGVHGIKLSKNSGHQNALVAGLFTVKSDMVVSVDADLQDDLGAIREMLIKYHTGIDIVYGVRSHRDSDTFFKRLSAEYFYRLLKVLGVDVVFNHADYRLMSRAAIEALKQYKEVNLYLRGIIPQLGFSTGTVSYKRAERFAGESKYPLRKMLALAWNGLTSFSPSPLRWITLIGFIMSLFSFGIGGWALTATLFFHTAIPGWASTVIPMYFLGGIQLLSVGIIGEYISKIYLESKGRPRFIIEKRTAYTDSTNIENERFASMSGESLQREASHV
jgi:glycosyltransferase involved in cell wall biosynthesis